MKEIEILASGDSALYCHFSNIVDPGVSEKILAVNSILKNKSITGVLETIPSYSGIMIYFNPLAINRKELISKLRQICNSTETHSSDLQYETVEVPVCYRDEYGPDLDYVARRSGLSYEEVISIHSSRDYRIYMLGFTPGFPYLGGIDKRIATPRRETPRVKINAGSVGIAGEQTGIYPLDSPGGWQIVGRTPLRLFDFRNKNPFIFKPGDYIRFRPVNLDTYFEIAESVRNGVYNINKIKADERD